MIVLVSVVSAISLYAAFLSIWESRLVTARTTALLPFWSGGAFLTSDLSMRSSLNEAVLTSADSDHRIRASLWLPVTSDKNDTRPWRASESTYKQNDKRNNTNTLMEDEAWNAVRFIPVDSLQNPSHFFSATWWQSKERFLRTFKPSRIKNVEGAVFSVIFPYLRNNDLRMTSDWLKFSVEHLSKTWKITGFWSPQETESYSMFVDKLLDYTVSTLASVKKNGYESTNVIGPRITTTQTLSPPETPSAMTETIAVVAFMPYNSGPSPIRGQVLTTANLAATLTSLIRVYCGRVLVVIDVNHLNEVTAQTMVATKQFLQKCEQQQNEGSRRQNRTALESFFASFPVALADAALSVHVANTFEFKVHQTEIGLVVVNCTEEDETKRRSMRMIPKAALMGLKKAFVGEDLLHTQQWLGPSLSANNTSKWMFTYLTEPDTILHARLDAMPALSQAVRKGNILVPHRLQPVPHERDLPNYDKTRKIPANGNFSNVLVMGPNSMCCDDGPDAPGYVKRGVCGAFWWECGFFKSRGNQNETMNQNPSERHFRLAHYKLVDLQEGTRIVSLAGTEQGRRCVPTTKLMENGFDCQ
ncbi:hypothetical protein ACA910_020247 [Epithemia clementina (nom. ined.)]